MAEDSGVEVGKAVLPVIPVMGSVGKALNGELKKSSGLLGKAGQSIGLGLGKSIAKGAKDGAKDFAEVERAIKVQADRTAKAVESAREREADAARKAKIAQQQYTEAVAKHGAESTRALQAEDRMVRAQRAETAARNAATRATKVQADEQSTATKELDAARRAADSQGKSWGALRNKIKTGLSGAKSTLHSFSSSASSEGRQAGSNYGNGLTSSLRGSIGKVGGLIAGAFAVDKLKDVAGFGLQVAAQNEQAQISFETMLGSGKKAQKFIGNLQKFAAKTPFDFPGLQQSASQLIAIGIDSKKVIPIMTTIGNITSGMGTGAEGVQRATVAIQQMNAAQKISAEDLNQLRDAGIPVYDLLSKATGKSTKQISQMAQSGKLGKKELDALMKTLESGKGLEKFDGLMDKQSESLSGMWSTIKDTFGQGLAKALGPALPSIKKVLGGLPKMLTPILAGLSKGIVAAIPIITHVVHVIGGLFKGNGGLSSMLQSVKPIFSDVLGTAMRLFGQLITAVRPLLPSVRQIFTAVGRVIAKLMPIVREVFNTFVGIIKKNSPQIKALIKQIVVVINQIADTIGPVFRAIWPIIKPLLGGAFANAIAILKAAFKIIGGMLKILHGVFTGNFGEIKDGAKQIFSAMFDMLKSLFQNGVKTLGGVWAGLKQVFATPINWIIDNVINKLIDAINWVADKLHISLHIDHVGRVSDGKTHASPTGSGGNIKAAMGSFRTGGPTGNIDKNKVAGVVHGNEHVVTAEEVEKTPGKHRTWARLRAMAAKGVLPGFRNGGRVWPTNTHALSGNYAGHSGVDIAASQGAPIFAPESGRIAYTGTGRGFGQAIFEQLGSGLQAVFGHTSKLLVKAGQSVTAGQTIGLVGATGHATGPHLHFEVNSPGPFGNAADRAQSLAYLNGADVSGSGSSGGIIGSVLSWAKDKIKGQLSKRVGLDGLSKFGALGEIGKGAASTLLDGATKLLFDKQPTGATPSGSGVGRWAGVIKQALAANGVPTSGDYVNAWLRQVGTESGGNEKAVQGITDVNSRSGDLAKGLLQTISATFNSFAFPGHRNIFNGLDNALAAIHYAKSRYGLRGMLGVIGHGHGYRKGTKHAKKGAAWVGEEGPEIVNFSGGEQVIPHRASMNLAKNDKAFAALVRWVKENLGTGVKGTVSQVSSAIKTLRTNIERAFTIRNTTTKNAIVDNYTGQVAELRKRLALVKGGAKAEASAKGQLVTVEKALAKARKSAKADPKDAKKAKAVATAEAEAKAIRKRLAAVKGSGLTEKALSKQLTAAEAKLAKARKLNTSKGVVAAADLFFKHYKKTNAQLADLAKTRTALAAKIKTAQDKLKNAIATRDDFKNDVVGAFKDYGSVADATSASQLTKTLRQRLVNSTQFTANLAELKKRGLNKSAYGQLVSAGPDGGLAASKALLQGGLATVRNVNSLQSQINTVGTSLGTTASRTLYQAGVDSAQGLVNGLMSKDKALGKAANRLASKLVGAVKKRLGIHSPSRVFYNEVGGNSVLGLTNRLDDGRKDVAAAGARLAAASVVSADTYRPYRSAQVNPAAAAGGAGGAVYVQNPFTGEYLLAKVADVSNGQLRVAVKGAKTART